ncbi:MAG: hypothetical protein ACE5GD_04880 [Candidatus Geothermarchaeales archaeon]
MREFLELEDIDALMRVAQTSNLVMRVDPYILIYFYGLIFYMDLGKLDGRDVSRIFQGLRDKLIIVKGVETMGSLHEFLREKLGE